MQFRYMVDNLIRDEEEVKKRAAVSAAMLKLLTDVVEHPEPNPLQKTIEHLVAKASRVEVDRTGNVTLNWSEPMQGWGYNGKRHTTLAIGTKGIDSSEKGITAFIAAHAEAPWIQNEKLNSPVGETKITLVDIQSVETGQFSDHLRFQSKEAHVIITDKGRVVFSNNKDPKVEVVIY